MVFFAYALSWTDKGFGVRKMDKEEDMSRVFSEAKEAVRRGHPVLIDAIIAKTEFREGSVSM